MRTTLLGMMAAVMAIAQAPFAGAQLKKGIEAVPVAKVAAKPDLIVCKFEPAKLTGAQRQQLRFRVYNIGKAAAPYHLLWADIGEFKNKLPVPPLNPGEYKEWIYPQASVGGGSQTVYTFWVDRDLWISESNEGNNRLDGVVKMNASEPVPRCSDGMMH